MEILKFIKEAGEKLFHWGPSAEAVKESNKKIEDTILQFILKHGLNAVDLAIRYDAEAKKVAIKGTAPDQTTREKIALCAGNIQGVEAVDDQMTVEKHEAPAQFYTVVPGDTLSKISSHFYGSANKYPIIFEANKPMLSDPNKIYPGQVLRIPTLS